jgi:cytochrome P450
MPKEWSWVFGHLLVLQKYVDKLPLDAAVTYATQALCDEFADAELYFMDFWPVYPPLYIVFGPELAHQISNKYNMPKTANVSSFMEPITGGPNLLTMNGDEWRRWRALFNPGFSTGAMLHNVPLVVDSVLTFREKLIEMIGKGHFSLDDFASRLTLEVILKVTL